MPTLHDTQTHTKQRDGGGLQPTAVNPDYWDLVPYSENNSSKRARLPGGQRQSSAELQFLHDESPQRAQIEQAEAAKIADSPALWKPDFSGWNF